MNGPDLAGMAELERAAQSVEAAPAEAQREAAQAQARQEADSNAADLESALKMCRVMAAPSFAWWPQFDSVWSDVQLRGIAEAGSQVMQRHGMSMADLMGKWGPYIALMVAAGGPVVVTWQAVKRHQASGGQPTTEPVQ